MCAVILEDFEKHKYSSHFGFVNLCFICIKRFLNKYNRINLAQNSPSRHGDY